MGTVHLMHVLVALQLAKRDSILLQIMALFVSHTVVSISRLA
jgi:hypothetical protein